MVSLPNEESVSGSSDAKDTSSSRSSLGGSSAGLMLPAQRIKMIMKSCPEVESVQQESLHTVTKATELFIAHLAKESFKRGGEDNKRLEYDFLSQMVQTNPKLEFLMETVPNKITWAECQKLIQAKQSTLDDIF